MPITKKRTFCCHAYCTKNPDSFIYSFSSRIASRLVRTKSTPISIINTNIRSSHRRSCSIYLNHHTCCYRIRDVIISLQTKRTPLWFAVCIDSSSKRHFDELMQSFKIIKIICRLNPLPLLFKNNVSSKLLFGLILFLKLTL